MRRSEKEREMRSKVEIKVGKKKWRDKRREADRVRWRQFGRWLGQI